MSELNTKILKWFAESRNKGLSSEAMALAATGIAPSRACHPHDPSDFNRCLLLIEQVPEVKDQFPAISEMSPVWKKLIQNWDELESCFLDEVGLNWSKGRKLHATKTYALIREIQERGNG